MHNAGHASCADSPPADIHLSCRREVHWRLQGLDKGLSNCRLAIQVCQHMASGDGQASMKDMPYR
jgi:hypothetical protein